MYTLTTRLDVHTHTIVSGHAFSTIQEMAQRAAELKLDILGITEHAPGIPGTCNPIYFRNIHVIPREMYGVRLLLGAELNILDTQGTLDLDENYYRILDLRIAGIHALCWQGGTREENTHGMVNAIRNPWTQIISHPGDGTADLYFPDIATKKFHSSIAVKVSLELLLADIATGIFVKNNEKAIRVFRLFWAAMHIYRSRLLTTSICGLCWRKLISRKSLS